MPLPDACCDRFLSVYVLDLLSDGDARHLVAEARRVLVPDGRLCLASMAFGHGPFSRAVCGLWGAVHALRPQLVGGCRPIRLMDLVESDFDVVHDEIVCTLGICTEVVIARPR